MIYLVTKECKYSKEIYISSIQGIGFQELPVGFVEDEVEKIDVLRWWHNLNDIHIERFSELDRTKNMAAWVDRAGGVQYLRIYETCLYTNGAVSYFNLIIKEGDFISPEAWEKLKTILKLCTNYLYTFMKKKRDNLQNSETHTTFYLQGLNNIKEGKS